MCVFKCCGLRSLVERQIECVIAFLRSLRRLQPPEQKCDLKQQRRRAPIQQLVQRGVSSRRRRRRCRRRRCRMAARRSTISFALNREAQAASNRVYTRTIVIAACCCLYNNFQPFDPQNSSAQLCQSQCAASLSSAFSLSWFVQFEQREREQGGQLQATTATLAIVVLNPCSQLDIQLNNCRWDLFHEPHFSTANPFGPKIRNDRFLCPKNVLDFVVFLQHVKFCTSPNTSISAGAPLAYIPKFCNSRCSSSSPICSPNVAQSSRSSRRCNVAQRSPPISRRAKSSNARAPPAFVSSRTSLVSSQRRRRPPRQ